MKYTRTFLLLLFVVCAIIVISGTGLRAKLAKAEDRFNPEANEGLFVENDDDFYDSQSCTVNAGSQPVKSGRQELPKRQDAQGFADLYSEDHDPAKKINPFYPPKPFTININVFSVSECIAKLDFSDCFGGGDLGSYFQNVKTETKNPDVDVEFQPDNAKLGETRQAVANIEGFEEDNGNVYVTWCVNGTSQQGLLAGGRVVGDRITQGVTPSRTCCAPVTRNPKDEGDVDKDGPDTNRDGIPDGDGMGDQWELSHFPGKTLDEIKPDEDPDGDGAERLTLKGRHCIQQPGSSDCVDVDRDGFPFITPYIYPYNNSSKLVGIGSNSGKLTNLEEYVWGTNPLNPDTNGDGVTDGDAIQGKGMNTITLKPDDFPGKDTFVRATIMGKSVNKIVKIDSEEKRLYEATGSPLAVTLSSDQQTPTPGKPMTVTANVQEAKFDESTLNFQWEITTAKGVMNCSNVTELQDYCGIGKNVMTIITPANIAPQEQFTVKAIVSESFTSKVAEKSIDLYAGSPDIEFDLAACTSDICDESSCDVTRKTPKSGEFVRAQVKPVVIPGLSLDTLAYVWNYEGSNILDSRAQGQKVCIKATGSEKSEHLLRLAVYGSGKDAISNYSENIVIDGPEVVLKTKTSESSVFAQASLRNFSEQAKATYTWTINGKKIENTSPYLAYTLEPDQKGKAVIAVSVIGKTVTGGVKERARTTKEVKIESNRNMQLTGKIMHNYLTLSYWTKQHIVYPLNQLF